MDSIYNERNWWEAAVMVAKEVDWAISVKLDSLIYE
jgi:hypothetical protein